MIVFGLNVVTVPSELTLVVLITGDAGVVVVVVVEDVAVDCAEAVVIVNANTPKSVSVFSVFFINDLV
jgi:hypothetical protein